MKILLAIVLIISSVTEAWAGSTMTPAVTINRAEGYASGSIVGTVRSSALDGIVCLVSDHVACFAHTATDSVNCRASGEHFANAVRRISHESLITFRFTDGTCTSISIQTTSQLLSRAPEAALGALVGIDDTARDLNGSLQAVHDSDFPREMIGCSTNATALTSSVVCFARDLGGRLRLCTTDDPRWVANAGALNASSLLEFGWDGWDCRFITVTSGAEFHRPL